MILLRWYSNIVIDMNIEELPLNNLSIGLDLCYFEDPQRTGLTKYYDLEFELNTYNVRWYKQSR